MARIMKRVYSTIAVLYQKVSPPRIGNGLKPVKPGGYSDSGADIAYALQSKHIPIVTPALQPDPTRNLDWVFPDTTEGIRDARSMGATILWANTILFKGHPIETAIREGVSVVGQKPAAVAKYDDKWVTNTMLRAAGCRVVSSMLVSRVMNAGATYIDSLDEGTLRAAQVSLPAILKPMRGRGSEGVCKVNTLAELKKTAHELLAATAVIDGKTVHKYGDALILESFLPGSEVTVTVMPPGHYNRDGQMVTEDGYWSLPIVKRFNHQDGVAPYNGVVAVVTNSAVLEAQDATDPAVVRLLRDCEAAARLVSASAPIRIDCRQADDGEFYMFDLNMKPNMTGAGRPGRDDQDSLTCLAARQIGATPIGTPYARNTMKIIQEQLALTSLVPRPVRRTYSSGVIFNQTNRIRVERCHSNYTSLQGTLGPRRTIHVEPELPLERDELTSSDYDILVCHNAEQMRMLLPAMGRAIMRSGFCIVELADSKAESLRHLADYFGKRQLHPRGDASGIVGGQNSIDLEWHNHRAQYGGVSSGDFFPHTDGSFVNGIGLADRQLVRIGPPKMVLLQCVKQSAHGGANLIIDGARVYADITRQEPHLAATLMRPGSLAVCRDDQVSLDIPVYQKLSDGRIWLRFRFDKATYSPAWALEALRHLHENYHMNPEYQVRVLLQPNQVLIVDNLRTLHAREAFKVVPGHENNTRKWHRTWLLNDEVEPLDAVAYDSGRVRAFDHYRHYQVAGNASTAQLFDEKLGIRSDLF